MVKSLFVVLVFNLLIYLKTFLFPSAEFQEQFVFTVLPIADCPEQDTLIQLFIATVAENVGAEGLVFFPLQNISEIFFNLSPGVGEFLNLPVMALPRKSTGPVRRRENSTVVVAATAETVVYVHVRCSQQKDSNPKSGSVRGTAFQIKGIRELGKYYRVLTFQKCGHAQVAIVAVKENTDVEIYMNDTSVLERDGITLQMYETYIIEGKFDITGGYIKASEPVFVLTGNDGDGIRKCACSNISSNSTSSSSSSSRGNSSSSNSSNSENTPTNSCGRGKDPFYECLIPYHHWGTHYYLFPLFDPTFTMVYKIISFENTKVTITEGQESVKNLSLDEKLGKFIEKTVTFSQTQGGVEVKSPEAILVAQFSVESKRSISMLLATPSSQFTRKYTVFPVFNISHVDEAATHYINIILPPGGQTNDLHINNDSKTTWENVGDFTDGSRVVRTILSPSSNLLENRGGYNITAVVSASHVRRSYTFALP
ncbi:hypothetical protein HOLleu_45134 [Holothuria leucospilota]|uniref:IgGFc-binding protein N-terminal domain-containing protein n=1 Tax=Holothuria leucospilota TaxID=206669 RepID=A0A9Q1B8G2_HOLLE|nr:hypothetical protein HOLleu_45134 [Holothuria leucospilota]